MPGTDAGRRGVLLPAMLLLIIAITLIAHGALVLAEAEADVSSVARTVLTARLSAEAGVVSAMDGALAWPVDAVPWSEQPIGAGRFGPHGSLRVTATLIEPELTLWEGVGKTEGSRLTYRVGRLAWRLSPGSRLANADAVVAAGGGLSVSEGSLVDGSRMSDVPAGWTSERCAPFAGALGRALPSGRLPPHATLPIDPPGVPPLGLLGPAELAARARAILPRRVTPRPRERDGECASDVSTNWGSPSSGGLCSDHFGLMYASGDLVISGGEGQGVLVVGGNLRLASESSFFGVILAAGEVRVTERSLVQGLVRARGFVAVTGSARIVGSGCAVLAALSRVETLSRPLVLPKGAWVAPFDPEG